MLNPLKKKLTITKESLLPFLEEKAISDEIDS